VFSEAIYHEWFFVFVVYKVQLPLPVQGYDHVVFLLVLLGTYYYLLFGNCNITTSLEVFGLFVYLVN
jgi:hypothetical protein